jgi:hypothetical protein
MKISYDSTLTIRYNQYTTGYDTIWQKDTTRKLGVSNFNIGNGTYTNRFVDAYIGFTGDIYDGLMLVGEYCLTWKKQERHETQMLWDNFYSRNRQYVIDESLDALLHSFYISVEKPIKGFWNIEQITPRAGLRWTLLSVISKTVPSYPTNATTVPFLATSTQRYPDSTTMPTLTLGLGIRAGIATIDTRVEIGQWNGLVSGPVGVEGTLTLDFKALPKPIHKLSRKADVTATPLPEKKVEHAAAPAPEEKPEEQAPQEPVAAPAPAKTEKKP